MWISFVVYFLVVFALVLLFNDFEVDALLLTMGLIGGLIVGAIVTGTSYGLIVMQTRKHYKSDKMLQQNQTHRISDEGIRGEAAGGTIEVKWDDVYKVVSSKTILAIYLGEGRAMVFPKATVQAASSDGWEALISLVKRHLSADKVKLAE